MGAYFSKTRDQKTFEKFEALPDDLAREVLEA